MYVCMYAILCMYESTWCCVIDGNSARSSGKLDTFSGCPKGDTKELFIFFSVIRRYVDIDTQQIGSRQKGQRCPHRLKIVG